MSFFDIAGEDLLTGHSSVERCVVDRDLDDLDVFVVRQPTRFAISLVVMPQIVDRFDTEAFEGLQVVPGKLRKVVGTVQNPILDVLAVDRLVATHVPKIGRSLHGDLAGMAGATAASGDNAGHHDEHQDERVKRQSVHCHKEIRSQCSFNAFWLIRTFRLPSPSQEIGRVGVTIRNMCAGTISSSYRRHAGALHPVAY